MILALFLTVVAVLPADRLAMADRLFNKGAYAAAVVEYRALVGNAAIAADDLDYRLAECARAQGQTNDAVKLYAKLVRTSPTSKHVDQARLQLALVSSGEERVRQLMALDSDVVAKNVRVPALYHLGVLKKDASILQRCVKLDPKGAYAASADFQRGALLVAQADATVRRKGVETLLGLAFGGGALAEEALYLAASTCARDKRPGEAASLLRRLRKMFPNGAHVAESRTLLAWCEYLNGHYADALLTCGDEKTDDLSYLRACCRAQTEDAAKAVPLFVAYLTDFPAGRYRADAELQQARLEFALRVAKNDFAGAREAAERATKSNQAADRLRLAWCYEKLAHLPEAEAEYARVIREHPQTDETAQALFARAMMAARAGDWSKTELSLAEALATKRLGSREAVASYWRGIAAVRLNHAEEGVAFLKAALQRGLGLDESREARLVIAETDYAAGRTNEAKTAYAQLVREGATARMSAARIYEVSRLVGPDEALLCAQALIDEKSPAWRQTGWCVRGAVEESRSAFSAAIDSYRKAVAEHAQTEELSRVALALGRLEFRAGEFAAAEATLKRAVELNAANPKARGEAYLFLAQTAQAKGDGKSAQGYATVVISLFDDPTLVAEAEKILKAAP